MKNLYIDFDNVITNTTKAFVDTYVAFCGKRYLHSPKPSWENVHRYDFLDQIPELTPQKKSAIFNSVIYQQKLELYPECKETLINLMKRGVNIFVVSHCSCRSIQNKHEFLFDTFGEYYTKQIKFIPILFDNFKGKSIINMSDGIFMDDCKFNLDSVNAPTRICFKYNNITMDVNQDWDGLVINEWGKETEEKLYNLLK